MSEQELPVLEVKGLVKHFYMEIGWRKKKIPVKAVDGVEFKLYPGETLGLVGETGCGKTTLSRLILRLLEPTEGEIYFEGADIAKFSPGDLRSLRSQMQMVFQDPFYSLNPRMTVGDIIDEPLRIFGMGEPARRREQVVELLELVDLGPHHYGRYPGELSVSKRQRVNIARALAVKPKLVVYDEPLAGLDVSIQSQFISLLNELRDRLKLTCIFNACGLNVLKHISHRAGVMYMGKIVELAPTDELYADPLHPYTRALLSAVPIPDPGYKKERTILQGEMPGPIDTPPGCSFHPCCPGAVSQCSVDAPEYREVHPGHWLACHLV